MTDRQPPEMRVSGAQSRPETACGWQPIATAPKDGENVLLWCGGPEPVIGFWNRRDGWGDDFPTHWMPLPAPPTEAGSDCLNTPPRSAERAALEIAVIALRQTLWNLSPSNAQPVAKALADIDILVPDAVKR